MNGVIGALTGIGGAAGVGPVAGVSGISGLSGTDATASTSGADFGAALAEGLQQVQGLQNNADQLAVQAATGQLTDVHDYMIASTESALATELTVAVRNKAVEAFNDVMRMQI